MNRAALLSAALAALLTGCAAGPVRLEPAGPALAPPPGAVEYCRRSDDPLCLPRAVQRLLQHRFAYRADIWDRWNPLRTEPNGRLRGDCEDYALSTLNLLHRADYAAPYTMAVCRTEEGGAHALVLIDTAAQTWAMDSRYRDLRPVSSLDLAFCRSPDGALDGPWRRLVATPADPGSRAP